MRIGFFRCRRVATGAKVGLSDKKAPSLIQHKPVNSLDTTSSPHPPRMKPSCFAVAFLLFPGAASENALRTDKDGNPTDCGRELKNRKSNQWVQDGTVDTECQEYCDNYLTICVDSSFFDGHDSCMAACSEYPRVPYDPSALLAGEVDPIMLGSDTLSCRMTHLGFALNFGGGGDKYQAQTSNDAAFHCGHASPEGEGICVDYTFGGKTPFQIMQEGIDTWRKFGACRLAADDTVASCQKSSLTDGTVQAALNVLPDTVEHLFLHSNELETVPDLSRFKDTLKSLYLDGNNIGSVSKMDFNLPELEILSLNQNPIVELPENLLKRTPKLKSFVYFTGNGGESAFNGIIPKRFFRSTPDIVNIIMYGHHNIVEFESGVFDGLSKAEIISFVDCRLSFDGFPNGVFDDLVSVQYFDFFLNNLSGKIPSDLFGPWATNIFRVVFWANPLTGIEEGAFDVLENVEKIFLHGTGAGVDIGSDTFAHNPELTTVTM